jgi:uncharacterized iron-regulated protein
MTTRQLVSIAVLIAASVATLVAGLAPAQELDLLPLGEPERAFTLGSAAPGSYYDTHAGQQLSFDEMIGRFASARVVLLGEEHTSMEQKLMHGRILQALAERGVKLMLGMEFFLREDNQSLAGWSTGELDEEQLLDATGWYDRGSYHFGLYRPVMEVARKHAIPVVGLNVPREIPRAINRGGIDSLSDEQRAEIGEITTGGCPQHRYLISRYFGETVAMLPPAWFNNMYTAQSMWDVVMARSILGALPDDATMVVIVGSGHVAYDLGIPRRIDEELASQGKEPLPVAVLCPVTAPAPDPEGEPAGHPMGGMGGGGPAPAQFVRSLADIVAVFAGAAEPFPRLGLSLKENDEGIEISMVLPETPAKHAGFASGDHLVDVNGIIPSSLSQLRRLLARQEWGQRLDLRIDRGEETLDIAVLLYPEVELTETSVLAGWQLEPVGELDPTGSAPVATVDAEQIARRVLVSKDGTPRRVEVWRGKVLDEVHELDGNSRVARSLYRQPLLDGAVEIRYQRAEDGSVTDTSRYSRHGERI